MKQLISREEIQQGVERLAREVSQHYGSHPVTMLGVLTGSVVLLADVIRRIDLPLRVGVIQARSYRGAATRPGQLEIDDSMMPDIRGRDVLLLDDIFDTGKTLANLISRIGAMEPRSVRSAVLLRKSGRCEVEMQPDHVVFDIPDVFVVGYGLDYQDSYRHLPYIAALEANDLEKVPAAETVAT
jgi:hypoxanthine phosphoribosyltransferase